jgi:hypothetical protein
MSTTLIADHWEEIERLGGTSMTEEHRELLRGIYLAGAMAAFHVMTGWDPESASQSLEIDYRNLTLLSAELSEAYHAETGEIYAEALN